MRLCVTLWHFLRDCRARMPSIAINYYLVFLTLLHYYTSSLYFVPVSLLCTYMTFIGIAIMTLFVHIAPTQGTYAV
jgi:hypothetical protein